MADDIVRRAECQYFQKGGMCSYYKFDCFHVEKPTTEPPSSNQRCNKLIPRTIEEMLPWMVEGYCEDCNEVCHTIPGANDGCDTYFDWCDEHPEHFENSAKKK